VSKMDFWNENVVEVAAIESFLTHSVRFKAHHVLSKGKKIKGILSRLMDSIPDGRDKWKEEVREKLFSWRRKLKHLKKTANECM